jgi:hypothetical protein
MSSVAMRTTRRATYSGSHPPSSIRASQYNAASGELPAHGLVQRADLVVKNVSALVETACVAEKFRQHGLVDAALVCKVRGHL